METVIKGYVHGTSLCSVSHKITDPAWPRGGLEATADSSFTPDQLQEAEHVDSGT